MFTPQIALGEDGCWKMSLNGVLWKNLSTDIVPSLKEKTEASYSLFKSASVTEAGTISLQTAVGELALELEVDASAATEAEAWKKFMMQAEDNVLLDFSYAGYMHGEVAPPDVMIDLILRLQMPVVINIITVISPVEHREVLYIRCIILKTMEPMEMMRFLTVRH